MRSRSRWRPRSRRCWKRSRSRWRKGTSRASRRPPLPRRCRNRLRQEFEEAAKDLADLEKSIMSLRSKEKELESSQEDFYATFKGAVADVQLAQGKLDAWEKINRELLLEKERIDLRREDVCIRSTRPAAKRRSSAKERRSRTPSPPPRRAVSVAACGYGTPHLPPARRPCEHRRG